MKLSDGNGVELGTIIFLDDNRSETVTIMTPTGHLVALRWDGSLDPGQIYYDGAGCTGNALLNSGSSSSDPIYGKTAVYSGSLATLMVPSTVSADGSTPRVTMTAAAIDNPTCGTSTGTKNGYALRSATATEIGLPAYPVATPLSIG